MNKPAITSLLLAVALAAPAVAGGKSYKCDMDTQTCLNEMVKHLQTRGWVGLELDDEDPSGLLVVRKVIAGSPAEAAGFKEGDKLVALNGAKFPVMKKDEPEMKSEELKKESESMVPGKVVEYTIGRGGSETKLKVTLGKLPPDVLAQWVGMHMLEHAKVAEVEHEAPKPSSAP
ncbi:MAG: PDZ domain-containing protein [Acidobacteriota bacterium]